VTRPVAGWKAALVIIGALVVVFGALNLLRDPEPPVDQEPPRVTSVTPSPG
jgi:hypothetical protein